MLSCRMIFFTNAIFTFFGIRYVATDPIHWIQSHNYARITTDFNYRSSIVPRSPHPQPHFYYPDQTFLYFQFPRICTERPSSLPYTSMLVSHDAVIYPNKRLTSGERVRTHRNLEITLIPPQKELSSRSCVRSMVL